MRDTETAGPSRAKPHWIRFAAVTLLALTLAACGGGDDGAPGAPGAPGPAGPPGPGVTQPAATATGDLTGAVTGVSIDQATGIPTVTFSVKNAAGQPVTGATNFEFTAAKLIPATSRSEERRVG